jgi:hypothetical protein
LVWQDKTAQNIIGQRFNEYGAKQDQEIILLTHATAMLQLYGASGQATSTPVDLDIIYKKIEAGVDQKLIASFTEKGE